MLHIRQSNMCGAHMLQTKLFSSHALPTQVEWSKCGDPELELVTEGDPKGKCPTVFVNHMAYWGPCPKAQEGMPCNCPM
jgi:hypothetical protein